MVCRHGWNAEDYQLYMTRYAASDVWAIRGAGLLEGQIAASHELWAEDEMCESAFYREFLAPKDWHFGMGAVFLRTESSMSAISLLRPKREGPCGTIELTLMQEILPHLRRAALLHGELHSLRSQQSAFSGHLDRYPQAFLLTDADGRILYINRAGRELMSLRGSLQIESGRLRASTAKDNETLNLALKNIAMGSILPHRRLEIGRTSSRRPHQLLLLPVPSSGAIPLGVAEPSVAILILDAESAPQPDLQMLADLFSLTPAEARVASLLVRGKNVEEVAAELDVSFTTVRSHVRSVLSKTDTNRQGALISLVLRTLPFERL